MGIDIEELRSDKIAILFLTFWILWTAYVAYNIYLFFKNKNSFYIKIREPWLILTSALGQYLMMTVQTWKIVLKPENFPNFVNHWFIWIAMPLHFLPYPLRAIIFNLKYLVRKTDASQTKTVQFFKNHPKLMSSKAFVIYNYILMGVAFLVGIIRQFTVPDNNVNLKGGGVTQTTYIMITCLLVFVEVFIWITIYFLRNIHDEVKINTELTSIAFVWIAGLVPYIIAGLIALKKPEINRLGPIFNIFVCFASFLITFGMPIHFSVIKPPDVDLGTNIPRNIDGCFEDKEIFQLLKEYSEKTCTIVSLKFYEDVKEYTNISDDNKRTAKYHYIIDTYIKPINGEDYTINVSEKKIKAFLAQKESIVSNSFNDLFVEIKKIINQEIIAHFLQTDEAKALIDKRKGMALVDINETKKA